MYNQLTHIQAEQLIHSKDDVIIADVRDKKSYDEGHIVGAVHLSMAKLQEFCEGIERKKPILLYCYHGISSQSVAEHLVSQGFKEVYSLIGGYETWKAHHPASDANS